MCATICIFFFFFLFLCDPFILIDLNWHSIEWIPNEFQVMRWAYYIHTNIERNTAHARRTHIETFYHFVIVYVSVLSNAINRCWMNDMQLIWSMLEISFSFFVLGRQRLVRSRLDDAFALEMLRAIHCYTYMYLCMMVRIHYIDINCYCTVPHVQKWSRHHCANQQME